MIPIPESFTVRYTDDAVILDSPCGEIVATYVERLRPIVPLDALWGDMPMLYAPQRLVTDEGEYAWLLEGARDDAAGHVTRILGAVVGDEFLAVLDVTTTTPGRHAELGELVETLLRRDLHALGARRRPYIHAGPSGWSHKLRPPFYAEYRPARGDAYLYVPPAMPRELVSSDELLACFDVPDDAAVTPVHASLSGNLYAWTEGEKRLTAFLLEDQRYFYGALAAGGPRDAAAAEHALDEVLASVEGFPVPRSRGAVHANLWAVD